MLKTWLFLFGRCRSEFPRTHKMLEMSIRLTPHLISGKTFFLKTLNLHGSSTGTIKGGVQESKKKTNYLYGENSPKNMLNGKFG